MENENYAVLDVPGDERSRTNWIERNNESYEKKEFKAVVYKPIKVTAKTLIEIE